MSIWWKGLDMPICMGMKLSSFVFAGVCNHAFHFHCISRWLKTRQVCPLGKKSVNYLQGTVVLLPVFCNPLTLTVFQIIANGSSRSMVVENMFLFPIALVIISTPYCTCFRVNRNSECYKVTLTTSVQWEKLRQHECKL